MRPGGDEVLDRREHAVAGTALVRGGARIREPTRVNAGIAGEQTPVLADHRMTVLVRDQAGLEVVVPATVRPPHVMEQQQRQLIRRRSRVEHTQLVTDGEIVVVAVEDHHVREGELLERDLARLADQIQRRGALRELHQRLLGGGVDRGDAGPRRPSGGPVEQHAGQIAGICADFRYRPRPDRFQARQDQLRQLCEREPVPPRIAHIRIEVGGGGGHRGASSLDREDRITTAVRQRRATSIASVVIGERFAWAHLPKTGGDATRQMLLSVPGLVSFADPPDSNDKHLPFWAREQEVSGKLLVMNIRRLPAWALSAAHHRATHGLHADYRPLPLESAEQMCAKTDADDLLRWVTDHGRFAIGQWLRAEYLEQDLLALLDRLEVLTPEVRAGVAAVGRVNVGTYEHELERWFSEEQIRRAYARNPGWAAIEREVYGELLVDR